MCTPHWHLEECQGTKNNSQKVLPSTHAEEHEGRVKGFGRDLDRTGRRCFRSHPPPPSAFSRPSPLCSHIERGQSQKSLRLNKLRRTDGRPLLSI